MNKLLTSLCILISISGHFANAGCFDELPENLVPADATIVAAKKIILHGAGDSLVISTQDGSFGLKKRSCQTNSAKNFDATFAEWVDQSAKDIRGVIDQADSIAAKDSIQKNRDLAEFTAKYADLAQFAKNWRKNKCTGIYPGIDASLAAILKNEQHYNQHLIESSH